MLAVAPGGMAARSSTELMLNIFLYYVNIVKPKNME